MHPILCLLLYCVSFAQFCSIGAINANDFKLTIIHANDLFSAFGGVNSDNTLCDLNDDYKQCLGGAPRIVSQINDLRSKEFVLFVSAGNNLGGFWYKHFGSKVVTDFLRELQFDVINLGLSDYQLYGLNHNTDRHYREGFENVTQFISDVSFFSRLVSCNVDVDTKYISNFYHNVRKSTRISRGIRRIGVIGFVEPPKDSVFDFIKIRDPIKCLQEESENLRKEGIDIIVAIGNGNEDSLRAIASNVTNVDLVLGSYGSTKNLSLLSQRTAENYPDFIEKGLYGDTIVATADVLGRSVGKLNVFFDKRGYIKSSEGTLIKIENKLDSDEKTLKLVDNYQRSLYIGTTKVFLNGNDCSTRECIIGNLITDSMVFFASNYINQTFMKSLIERKGKEVFGQRIDEKRDIIALISSESISNSIGNNNNIEEYLITKISLDNVLNRGNVKIKMFVLDGKTIRHLLSEHIRRPNELLQVSGLKVVYDLLKPINDTVIDVSVKCMLCSAEYYTQLNDEKLYDVLLPQSIQLDTNKDNILEVVQDMSAYDIVEQYIRENSPIKTTLENRITILGQKGKNGSFGANVETLVTLVSALIAVCHLNGYY